MGWWEAARGEVRTPHPALHDLVLFPYLPCGGMVSWQAGWRMSENPGMTVLFCDLVGSTALSLRLDPEEFRDVIADYHSVAERVVKDRRGRVAQFMGDGVAAYFESDFEHTSGPAAEAAALHAILAGLDLIDRVSDLKQPAGGDRRPLAVRVGVHTGPAVIGSLGNDRAGHTALGVAPQLAARIQQLAEPGSVAVSQRTRDLASAHFEFTEHSVLDVGSARAPIKVFAVTRPRGS